MTAPSGNHVEIDRDDGVTIETDTVTVELLPYATWREDGDDLPDEGLKISVIRFGRWVLCATRR